MRCHPGRLLRECRSQASEFAERSEHQNQIRDQSDVRLQLRRALLHAEQALRFTRCEDITALRAELARLKVVGDQAGRLIKASLPSCKPAEASTT
jgi:hypothetical protein